MNRDVLLGAAIATAIVLGMGAAMQGGPAGVYQVFEVKIDVENHLMLLNTATGETRVFVTEPKRIPVWSPPFNFIDSIEDMKKRP